MLQGYGFAASSGVNALECNGGEVASTPLLGSTFSHPPRPLASGLCRPRTTLPSAIVRSHSKKETPGKGTGPKQAGVEITCFAVRCFRDPGSSEKARASDCFGIPRKRHLSRVFLLFLLSANHACIQHFAAGPGNSGVCPTVQRCKRLQKGKSAWPRNTRAAAPTAQGGKTAAAQHTCRATPRCTNNPARPAIAARATAGRTERKNFFRFLLPCPGHRRIYRAVALTLSVRGPSIHKWMDMAKHVQPPGGRLFEKDFPPRRLCFSAGFSAIS